MSVGTWTVVAMERPPYRSVAPPQPGVYWTLVSIETVVLPVHDPRAPSAQHRRCVLARECLTGACAGSHDARRAHGKSALCRRGKNAADRITDLSRTPEQRLRR